ncbi:MAG: SPFH domain-containing protein [Propionibacteriales bacterium]|nr:SPFH domain-containing protein [Propionibacteriales bacterium]
MSHDQQPGPYESSSAAEGQQGPYGPPDPTPEQRPGRAQQPDRAQQQWAPPPQPNLQAPTQQMPPNLQAGPSQQQLVPADDDLEAPVQPGGAAPRIDVEEHKAFAMNGFVAWVIIALLWIAAIGLGVLTVINGSIPIPSIVMIVVALVLGTSVTVVQPGQAKVLQFFGRYIGTVRRTGLVLTVPWTSKTNISTKIENFETNELKVNDADGNPVNIAAIVVWQVSDTAKATFSVEQYHRFVAIQAEAALRHVASKYPYDNAPEGEPTLRESTDVVAAKIADEVNARVHLAGVSIIETRISTLAYAPEIAHAMLQRQQATAVIAAREKILEGAVGMVNGALRQLESSIPMDDHHRAEMVSNLLVVLTSDGRVTPVINAGSSMPREHRSES